jgi:hypothetical protein
MLAHKKYLYCVFAALFSAANTSGQMTKQDSLHVFQDNRAVNYFDLTGNAATIDMTPFAQQGFAKISAITINGDFRRPMEAEASNPISLATGGFKKINGWSYLTNFTYTKQYDTNIAWSGVADAYEGNPFIWADSSVGNWERDHIRATISIAAPVILKKLQTGLTLDYRIGSGARISEPKPFYRKRYFAIQPGLNWLLSKNNSAGLTGKVDFLQEENELGFYSEDNVLLYRLRGYGTFSKSPFVSGERKRKGVDLQTTAHYQQQWRKYNLLLSAFIARRNEEINEGIAIQQQAGFFNEVRFGGNAVMQSGNATKGKSLLISYLIKSGFADDIIFRAQSASYRKQLLASDISTWHTSDFSNSVWQFTLSPEISFIDNTDQATRTQLTATTVGSGFKVNWRKKVRQNVYLQLQPSVGYYHFLSGGFTNRTPNTITENIVRPDFDFFATNRTEIGTLVSVEVKPAKATIIHSLSI